MAKKAKSETKLNYAQSERRLRELGPQRLYFLWGPEIYLREAYVAKLKKLCLPEGEDSFSYHRFNGPALDTAQLADAIDALPFLTERSFIELREMDLNHLGQENSEQLIKLLRDIPDYCSIAFVQNAQFEPDGRLKIIKELRAAAEEIKFTSQPLGKLTDWIVRRFAAAGKSIDLETAQHLIFISGDLMSGLIPEIEKVAAYAKEEKVTVKDVDAVANHIPEAEIFAISDFIAQRKYDGAVSVLAELLSDKRNEPQAILALLGTQMRRLYAARVVLDAGEDSRKLMELCGLGSEYPARLLLNAARGYTLPQLRRAVEICAETDYRSKSGGGVDRELLIEALLRIAAGESDEEC